MTDKVYSCQEMPSAPPEALVCYCARVGKGQVLAAIQAGARTRDDIKALTGACTTAKCQALSPRQR